jgi:molecular chaperone HscA
MAIISINIKEGTLKKEDYIIGIDLGTTNSLVAIIDKASGLPKAISGNDKSVIVPSVIHLKLDGNFEVGNQAMPFLISDPHNTIFSVKRLMGRSYKDVTFNDSLLSYKIIDDNTESLVKIQSGDKFYTPIELSSFILKELKFRAEKALDAKVSKAVITVPAYFNDSQRQATRDAGKLAGLDVLRIVNEPTAASLAYGIGLNKEEHKTIAVYDLGGGTFDISIMRIESGIFEVLSTHGDTHLGGDDFDKVIVNHWLNLEPKLQTILDSNPAQLQFLRLLAEEAKKALSDQENFNKLININNQSFDLKLSRAEFELGITPIVEKTMVSCKQAMLDAKLSPANIDEVIMVGGSTRIGFVKQAVKNFFQKIELHDTLNPDEVVALGAAVEADILAGNRSDILLLDVTPLSLGIETLGGLMDVIIPRNSKVPQRAARQYTTSKDGQSNLRIAIYQGERDNIEHNRKLGEFHLSGIPGMPAGLPKIEVTFMLDADGILKVSAKELRSGIEQTIDLKPQYGLTDEELENMLLDSLQNAKDDMNFRALKEATTEAEQLIYTTLRFIEKNENELMEVEEVQTRKYVDMLKAAVETANKDEILKAHEALNDYTRPFAERIMDKAIGMAIKGKAIDGN